MVYLLEANALNKYYGADRVLTEIRLQLKEGEKAGLVGPNGAGKTTLLNCLSGHDPSFEGTVRLAPFATLGYLEQSRNRDDISLLSAVLEVYADIFDQRSRLEEMERAMGQAAPDELGEILVRYGNERDQYERADGFASEAKVRRVLRGLGFQEEQFDRPVGSFSGGEKTRIGLARILVRDYALLFLDEPTNHLDLDSVEWLENYLKDYPGAALIISHDRYFLDKVTETTFDLENGRLKRYTGNYSRYAAQKDEERKAQSRAYDKQQKEIEETEAYITRYKAGIKSKQARGRQSRLDRMDRLERPGELRAMHMGKASLSGVVGDRVLLLDGISFSYGDKHLFSDVSADIRFGERVALLGPNGAGKTTILKLITGLLKAPQGSIFLGPSVKPAYFDQEHQNLCSDNTVLDEILYGYDLNLEEAKGHLARFLFFADDIGKKVGSLSGGEQGRLSLLKLTLDKGNFLILDEPTNHLDIQSREVMEDYLSDYEGTLLLVSHDRYFIDRLAERVLELRPEGLLSYVGNYTDYRERKAWMERLEKTERVEKQAKQEKTDKQEKRKKHEPSTDYHVLPFEKREGKGEAPDHPLDTPARPMDRFMKAKLRKKLQDLEREIATLEEDEADTISALSDPETYSRTQANDLPRDLDQKLRDIQARLPAAYREWEETAHILEEA